MNFIRQSKPEKHDFVDGYRERKQEIPAAHETMPSNIIFHGEANANDITNGYDDTSVHRLIIYTPQ